MSNQATNNDFADFPKKLRFLFSPKRYKVAKGGRGAAKSWGFARALLIQGAERPLRIVCARETMKSIEESVYQLLCDQIKILGYESFYTVTNKHIVGANGATFSFVGLRQASVTDIKSFEGVDICWVEEAQVVTKKSWDILIPTIRKKDSEIWVSYNPDLESDETHQRFAVNPPPADMCEVATINWYDNPWFPEVLRLEMEQCRHRSEEDYLHIYEGMCKQVVEGAIYRQEIIQAEKEQRITGVPYDPLYPVYTFWDLGFGDNTSIWFAQSIGFEFRLIDHLSDSLKSLSHYIKQLQEKPYVYATHWLPWDGAAAELGSGRSIQEQLGQVFGSDRVRCAKKLSVEDGIAAARVIFPKCWFDRTKCSDGLQSLRHYRYEHDDELGTFKRAPLHDWASHDADAFRTLAVSIKEHQRPMPKPQTVTISAWERASGDGQWMA